MGSVEQQQIDELERRISALPAGSVTKKSVRGKEYFYRRWTENGKRHEKYLPADEVPAFKAGVEERKRLEQELKSLKARAGAHPSPTIDSSSFTATIRTGIELRAFTARVRSFKRRACYQQLRDYLRGAQQDKVFVLYGLRRTGKTTLIRQALDEMSDAELGRAAFIQVTASDTLASLNRDLRALEEAGVRYVFIDEVTLIEDFVKGAALFSDVFATCGMRVVLSGADSLGFLFAQDEQLYDRCIMAHTTFIPYREFESVLGVSGIDEYIRYGGTMSLGGEHYNETSTFSSARGADEYVDTAIAHNIQHSLRCYQDGGHFSHLRDLYDRGELTSAINRVVEDINHRIALDVLTRDFKSHDLGVSANNLRRDRKNPTDVLDRIDVPEVTRRLRALLEIRNRGEQTVELTDAHVMEIKEYLELLDLVRDVDVRHLPNVSNATSRTLVAQPGLRYAQASSLIQSLLLDETFAELSLVERNAVQARILSEIQGRMLEDIVLLETKLAYPNKQVFVLQFPIGEFDMVVFDPAACTCEIYEIKHSTEATPLQYRHLIDEEKCSQTQHRYGEIAGKTVLYRGESHAEGEIRYKNVEEYLRELGAREG